MAAMAGNANEASAASLAEKDSAGSLAEKSSRAEKDSLVEE
jgi:hypothetical protein